MQKNRISINQIKNKQIMNKKVMKAVFVAAIAMVSGINVFNAQKSEMLSDIALANVEALAGEEWDGDNHCFMDTTFWVCLKYATGVGCYCGL